MTKTLVSIFFLVGFIPSPSHGSCEQLFTSLPRVGVVLDMNRVHEAIKGNGRSLRIFTSGSGEPKDPRKTVTIVDRAFLEENDGRVLVDASGQPVGVADVSFKPGYRASPDARDRPWFHRWQKPPQFNEDVPIYIGNWRTPKWTQGAARGATTLRWVVGFLGGISSAIWFFTPENHALATPTAVVALGSLTAALAPTPLGWATSLGTHAVSKTAGSLYGRLNQWLWVINPNWWSEGARMERLAKEIDQFFKGNPFERFSFWILKKLPDTILPEWFKDQNVMQDENLVIVLDFGKDAVNLNLLQSEMTGRGYTPFIPQMNLAAPEVLEGAQH